ncbi:hypothetical protein DOTSEDRAFT_52274 [Dothistroma septosporum NZE10]|uniref:Zn(2)-C6 fungal-type domain-containing protein n=1 Tax=Dothistroma septosporum (strain NZE10 / CBS 128990) TaxID=675120 RepID=N1PQY8_DOTSN|nr:hypothetical protein DOTSEDRAFT_52274 [Dothistroma septosporum NZE10]
MTPTTAHDNLCVAVDSVSISHNGQSTAAAGTARLVREADMPREQTSRSPTQPTTRVRAKHRRSRNACQECHVRKIRCNVTERGTPCSNCVDVGETCVIRRRKGFEDQRSQSPATQHHEFLDQCHSFQVRHLDRGPIARRPSLHESTLIPATVPTSNDMRHARVGSPAFAASDALWSADTPYTAFDHGSASADIDISHLADIDDIFAFTRETAFAGQEVTSNGLSWFEPSVQQYLSPSNHPATTDIEMPEKERTISMTIPGLSASDDDYLRQQGCFRLPPPSILRRMVWSYFEMVHPNLPIVPEDEFWSLWDGLDFKLVGFSFLLIKAMVFAATSFVEPEVLSSLGFSSKRDARIAYYKQAKSCFDVGIERNPIALAQSCLLLTYHAPTYNTLRVNSYWLKSAAHFAKIAHADHYWHVRATSKAQSTLLKRVWWGVVLRDRILALLLRRTVHVPLEAPWTSQSIVLQANDFEAELGKSHVYQLDAQHRIITVISATCRLMQHLTEALHLYRHEDLQDRLDHAGQSLSESVTQIKAALASLSVWYEQASAEFPFPIGLDDADETPAICIYANMAFCYYSSAVFALNQHLILLAENFSAAQSLFSVERARELLESSNKDIGQRVQEFVQVRLVKYLPISASAFIGIPLVLQAVNLAAAHGSKAEAAENRRLQIFMRTLQAQQERFDGSDFCADVLSNIVAYAQNDEKFQSSMANWRGGRNGNASGATSPSSSEHVKVKLDWANLVHRRPRLFLRIMLYWDHALCTGAPPQDSDFPLVLRDSRA